MIDHEKLAYDAILLVSFGGPEGPDEVIPFLENVLRGKNVPRERLAAVAQHYYLFGGVSPINEHCRILLKDLQHELDQRGIETPLFWGNRNWHPLLADTIEQMKERGCRKAIAFVTSAYSSYSGCRQYLEDIEGARAAVGAAAPLVDKIPVFYNHPLFIEANVLNLKQALAQLSPARRSSARVAFTAHSLPQVMAGNCLYESQLDETCRAIAAGAKHPHWQIVFQSRSGPASQPWLEPDILDHLKSLKTEGVTDVVIAPVGFLFDHMEVIYDLDREAKNLCLELGINLVRAYTVGKNALFVKMAADLIEERLNLAKAEQPSSQFNNHDFCHVDCCRSGVTRPSQPSAPGPGS